MITRVGTCEDKGKGLAFAYNLMRYKQKLPRMDKKELTISLILTPWFEIRL
jgi:hypothetical protein